MDDASYALLSVRGNARLTKKMSSKGTTRLIIPWFALMSGGTQSGVFGTGRSEGPATSRSLPGFVEALQALSAVVVL